MEFSASSSQFGTMFFFFSFLLLFGFSVWFRDTMLYTWFYTFHLFLLKRAVGFGSVCSVYAIFFLSLSVLYNEWRGGRGKF